jgi:hypothetical protein
MAGWNGVSIFGAALAAFGTALWTARRKALTMTAK